MLGTYVDPASQDYVLLNGVPEQRNVLLTLAYMRLRCPRGTWILNKDFGNPLAINSLSDSAFNRKQYQAQVKEALQDLVALGYARDVTVVVTRIVPAERRVVFSIEIIDNFLETIQFVWTAAQ